MHEKGKIFMISNLLYHEVQFYSINYLENFMYLVLIVLYIIFKLKMFYSLNKSF